MSRHILPGTDKAIYVLTKDQDEFDSDIDALEDILDKTEAEIHKTRVYLAIIRENKHEIINNHTNESHEPT